MYNRCKNIVQTLHKHWTNIVQTLSKHCANNVQTLSKDCTKHCLSLRNRHVRCQNIAYLFEVDLFLSKALTISSKSIGFRAKH